MRLLRAMAVTAAALAVCGCYDRFGHAADEAADPDNANITIAGLTGMYRGSTVTISENLVIAGRVTSSDRAGNFYRSFTVEQGGAAVEIMAGLNELHNIWPVGSGVAVRLQGLAMGESSGVKCIGLPPEGYGYLPVDYIPSRAELDMRISRTHDPEPFGIPNFSVAMLDRSMCGRLIRVVSLVRIDDGTEEPLWGGRNIFEDEDEHLRIAVSVSGYADFAARPVGTRTAAITGILQYGRPDGTGEEMFILKPRDEKDIQY